MTQHAEQPMMALGVAREPVPTHYIWEQYTFADTKFGDGVQKTDAPERLDQVDYGNQDDDDYEGPEWTPVATRDPEEYIEALQLCVEAYWEREDDRRRVWIETIIAQGE